MTEIKAVVFDLDNTLYDAEQYFFGAFEDISTYMYDEYGTDSNEVFEVLLTIWKEKTSMYPDLFNDMLKYFNIYSVEEIKNIVQIFNNHECKIKPRSDVIPTINLLRKDNIKLGIITDGTVHRQERKIKVLGLAEYFDIIIYTKHIGHPKPGELSFQKAIDNLGVKPCQMIYVGDNPYIDFEGAKKTGMITARLLKGEFSDIDTDEWIDYNIKNMYDVLYLLHT
ncbi:MAG: putative hydrolase of the HAD superfamily [Methanohalophilus sp.]|nr:MAG: putative hydrolase of the HAD superfamily [Methanohalophilus sp.]